MRTSRRGFLGQSAKVGAALALDEVLRAENAPAAGRHYALINDRLRLDFDDRGLVSMRDVARAGSFRVMGDRFSLMLNKERIDSAGLGAATIKTGASSLSYTFTSAPWRIEVIYELRKGWSFVTKQILVSGLREGSFSVERVEPLRFALGEDVSELYVQDSRSPAHVNGHSEGIEQLRASGAKEFAAFLRMRETEGLFLLLQNPFFECNRQGNSFSLEYLPEMQWNTAWGPFPCDRACIGTTMLTGRKVPKQPTPEWHLGKSVANGQDEGEVEAVTECVRAHFLFHLEKSAKIHFGWYENDYQIDIGSLDGRAEYKRIIDTAAGVGCEHLVFAPQNTGVSNRAENTDNWDWEYVLWLSLGQKLRKDRWRADHDPVPESIREMVDYAGAKKIKLMAYVYPVLPFSQNREWLTPDGKNASLGHRSWQDWLLENLVAFQRKTGIGGFAFDYVFLALAGSSPYSQWFGWRRVLEGLRAALPDIRISGGAFHGKYGPWIHLAGNYPWPMFGDENPESIADFPDLHFARVEANRMRYITFLYKNYEYCPTEELPGFMSHQEPRHDGRTEQEDIYPMNTGWRLRNFDYLGWKYSVISSIGYAPFNHVVAMLPGRDPEEFRHFSETDKAWLRGWMAWSDANRDTLRNSRLILGEPGLGKADGSAAIAGDRGYIFLFNPNGRRVQASFTLDSSIGLHGRGRFILREFYPLKGRRWGKPERGAWEAGDRVTVTLDGTSATVLSLEPAVFNQGEAVLFNAPGRATLKGGHLALTGVEGEVGTELFLNVLIPGRGAVETVTVNGSETKFEREGETFKARVRFEGQLFSRSQQVGSFDPEFTGGVFHGEFQIPARIKHQLDSRKLAWPLPWTEDDLRCTWLAPERLFLFVQMGNPDSKMPVSLKIDGEEVTLARAYSSIRPNPNCFVGYFADVSRLETDTLHIADLSLPELEPGRFQGLFFDNVETEYTEQILG